MATKSLRNIRLLMTSRQWSVQTILVKRFLATQDRLILKMYSKVRKSHQTIKMYQLLSTKSKKFFRKINSYVIETMNLSNCLINRSEKSHFNIIDNPNNFLSCFFATILTLSAPVLKRLVPGTYTCFSRNITKGNGWHSRILVEMWLCEICFTQVVTRWRCGVSPLLK